MKSKRPNIHYVLMAKLIFEDLKPTYESYKDFKETHNISEELENRCFGKNYFKRVPNFHNSIVITKMLRYLEIEAVAHTVYPTHDSVQFNIVKRRK